VNRSTGKRGEVIYARRREEKLPNAYLGGFDFGGGDRVNFQHQTNPAMKKSQEGGILDGKKRR